MIQKWTDTEGVSFTNFDKSRYIFFILKIIMALISKFAFDFYKY